MKNIYLTRYAVKGIKNLDRWVELSFYKKTFDKEFNIKGYNVKAIYGENGSGKSALMASAKILKGLLLDPYYLSNTLIQQKLLGLANKVTETIEFDIEFYCSFSGEAKLYRYQIKIGKNTVGKYYIKSEVLSLQGARSHSNNKKLIYQTEEGELIKYFVSGRLISPLLMEKTKNLLSNATLLAVYFDRIGFPEEGELVNTDFELNVLCALTFGFSIFVYMDSEDEHTDYAINELLSQSDDGTYRELVNGLKHIKAGLSDFRLYPLSPGKMTVGIKEYESFEKQIAELESFIKIFKPQLRNITIDFTPNKEVYECSLLMNYGDYKVNSEYESTGIKKLIKLYPYLQRVVNGDIVFIDELDSNLHDVYLCALLEFFMRYSLGQLCFTTHNIGPMDVLKENKKSIDFLSSNHIMHSWTSNGHYSPSKLYKNGMIEDSPFNVDSIDFIGTFLDD